MTSGSSVGLVAAVLNRRITSGRVEIKPNVIQMLTLKSYYPQYK